MIYVISDLHGYPFEKFTALLRQADFRDEDFLYVLGDVIDRGADGVRYLLWLMAQKNVRLLLGNHELMMRDCDFLFDSSVQELICHLDRAQKRKLALWMSNGAESTVHGLFGIGAEERQAILPYLNGLPLYENVCAGERQYLLLHSGLRDFSPEKALTDYSVEDLVWNRPALSDRYFEDRITVFGHTPTFFFGSEYKGSIITTDTWIDIDAGAGYGNSPVLLRLDDLATFVAG